MLEPVMGMLNKQRVILASSSPRRQEILKNVGLKFEVIPSLYEENLNPEDFKNPSEFVIQTARNKTEEVHQRLKGGSEDYELLIGADTMVVANSKVIGKPKSNEEALTFLKMLNGATHEVHTGVCIKSKQIKDTIEFSEITKVKFGHVPEFVLKSYIDSGEASDKAGAYGIQGKGGTLVEKIEGDYFNVVGLPLYRLCETLLRIYAEDGQK